MINKNPEKPIQKYRVAIQILFAAISVWIGIEFYLFVSWLESGGTAAFYSRPPGVEGFLPISSMMSVYYFFLTGEIHMAHPAGFFIFIGILTVSLIFGKSFCSWMCPIGFISESIADFSENIQRKLFKRTLKIPKFLDVPLRGLKYLILFFFVYAIFFAMTSEALKAFLDSPFNIMSDVKMWYFFANISEFALIVISALFILSIIFRNFWCRYLCPYGALLGLFSILSPNKISRVPKNCIDCGLCAKACPSGIKVDEITTVVSDECSTCMSCVDVCPAAGALELKNLMANRSVNKKYLAKWILGLYFAAVGLGILTGYWQSGVSQIQYLQYYKVLNQLGHPRNAGEIKKFNERIKNKNNKLFEE